MWTADLYISAEVFSLKFICVQCNKNISTDGIHVPLPDYSSETIHESTESDFYSYECPKCHKVYNIKMYSSLGDSSVEVDELPDNHKVKVEYLDEDIEYEYNINELSARHSNSNFLQTFQNDIADLRQLSWITLDDWQLKEKHNRHLFVAAISSMEVFLSDTLINLVFQNEGYLEKFVTTYKGFKETKILLSNIYDEYSKIREKVSQELLKIGFHNLVTVRTLYHGTFNVEFPSIKELMELVNTRHDLVHRNGKTKDDIDISMDAKKLEKSIGAIEKFVLEIAERMALVK